jgi:hypothetical protein
MRRFYSATSALLPVTPAHSAPSPFSAFIHAYTLLSTRAFIIDLYHAAALVPFADILNHSSSPHTSLASDEFVCHRCGSMPVCTHDALLPGSECPARLAHLDPVVRDRVMRAPAADDTVEMRAERVVGRGCEVWNTYGEMGDARLLVEYGFLGEEFAGEGLRLGVSADEKVKEAWKAIMEGGGAMDPVSASAATASDRLSNAFEALALEAPEGGTRLDEEDALVTFTPPGASTPPHLALFLSHSAQVSFPLFALVCLASSQEMPGSQPTPTLDDIGRSLRDVERVYASAVRDDEDEAGGSGNRQAPMDMAVQSGTKTAARAVRDLLDARLRRMHRPDATLDELFDIKDVSARFLVRLSSPVRCSRIVSRSRAESSR